MEFSNANVTGLQLLREGFLQPLLVRSGIRAVECKDLKCIEYQRLARFRLVELLFVGAVLFAVIRRFNIFWEVELQVFGCLAGTEPVYVCWQLLDLPVEVVNSSRRAARQCKLRRNLRTAAF